MLTKVVWMLEGGNHAFSTHPSRQLASNWIREWAEWVQAGRPDEQRWKVITGDGGEGKCEWAIAFDRVIAAYIVEPKPSAGDRLADTLEKMAKDGSEWKE